MTHGFDKAQGKGGETLNGKWTQFIIGTLIGIVMAGGGAYLTQFRALAMKQIIIEEAAKQNAKMIEKLNESSVETNKSLAQFLDRYNDERVHQARQLAELTATLKSLERILSDKDNRNPR